MRRSAEPRVAARGEVLFEAARSAEEMAAVARIVNLSRGGVCVCGALPPPGRDEAWPIALGLGDGRDPIRATARLAWVNPTVEAGNDARTFGLCFTQLDARDRARLDAEVAMPKVGGRIDDARPVRLRLDGGPSLRATVESIGEHEAVVSAEISWLRVQSKVEAELDDRSIDGRVAWVGVEQSPSGATRLRLRLELGEPVDRRDTTKPYFTTDLAELEEPLSKTPRAEILATPPGPAEKKPKRSRRDPSGVHAALVKIGVRRRATLAVLRFFVVVLAVSAAALLVRSVRQSARAAFEAATSRSSPTVPTARP